MAEAKGYSVQYTGKGCCVASKLVIQVGQREKKINHLVSMIEDGVELGIP